MPRRVVDVASSPAMPSGTDDSTVRSTSVSARHQSDAPSLPSCSVQRPFLVGDESSPDSLIEAKRIPEEASFVLTTSPGDLAFKLVESYIVVHNHWKFATWKVEEPCQSGSCLFNSNFAGSWSSRGKLCKDSISSTLPSGLKEKLQDFNKEFATKLESIDATISW